ncbi:hypothetical protein HH212_11855 [Massilia forsythiae]|uniref:Uncharacterized protein n=1 Tax=Massilia forsythiae TaxID=2728020 RepID=A0A7Z2ZSL3_9BURK|nr:hypothetical protein [Massilia forsythiae]QJE00628.1 hypothetical protein HH212_11855 [Massilia forsythiae]
MSADYQLTSLADARPGMVLSDTVRDVQGNVLLAQGVRLSDVTLAALARHGVDSVPVARSVAAAAPDGNAVQTRLDHLFRSNVRDDHEDWATGLLRRYVEDYRLQREVAP